MKCSWLIGMVLFLFNSYNNLVIGEQIERWSDHPEWLWFDDFESGTQLSANYQDVDTTGFSIVTTDAVSGAHALQQHYTKGMVDAGWIIRVNNQGYPSHLFMRFYHKFENGFSGFPPKMARMRCRSRTDWKSAFAVNCWIDDYKVVADVYSTNSTQGSVEDWLPIAISNFSFKNSINIGKWICFEMEVLLNSPGKQDGLYRIWADNSLIVERTNVDLRGAEEYLINEVMLDCYWNGGSPKEQNRYFDNFVISTQRIFPMGANPAKQVSLKYKNTKSTQVTSKLDIDKSFGLVVINKDKNGDDKKFLITGASVNNR